jgi:hypothetical protein
MTSGAGQWIENPLVEEFWTYLDTVAQKAYDGKTMGGYIQMNGIDMGDNKYCDLWLYSTAGETNYEALRAKNATDQRTAAAPTAWADMAEKVTGLARIITYEKMINPYATTLTAAEAADDDYMMVSMYEGAVVKGKVNAKFGRLMTREGETFLGYLAGDPVTGEWGAVGKGIYFKDLYMMGQGMYNTTNPMGAPFDSVGDPDKFVWWQFDNFRRESPPYYVVYDEISGCKWADPECQDAYYAA